MIALDQLQVERNIVVPPNTSVHRVLEQMSRTDAPSALVVNGREAVGILTHRDILQMVNRVDDWEQCTVAEVMTSPVVIVRPDMSCHAAYQLMLEKGIRHLVLDPDANGHFRVIGEKAFLSDGRLRDDTETPRVESIMSRAGAPGPRGAETRHAG